MKKFKQALEVAFVAGLAGIPFIGGAQVPPPAIKQIDDIIQILNNIVRWLYIIFFILAVLFVLLAAFNYLTAQGDEEKVGKAKKQIWFAVIAVIVALLATSVIPIVRTFLQSKGSQ
jgi:uncharacterized membrane protein